MSAMLTDASSNHHQHPVNIYKIKALTEPDENKSPGIASTHYHHATAADRRVVHGFIFEIYVWAIIWFYQIGVLQDEYNKNALIQSNVKK